MILIIELFRNFQTSYTFDEIFQTQTLYVYKYRVIGRKPQVPVNNILQPLLLFLLIIIQETNCSWIRRDKKLQIPNM